MKNLQLIVLLVAFLVGLSHEQWIEEYKAFTEPKLEELDGWVIQNQHKATTDIITKCGDINIIGGLNVFGQKSTMTKMVKIPPHYRLKFNMQFWKIAGWENDKIQVFVDGVPWEMKWGFTEGTQKKLCNGPDVPSSDKVYDVEFEFAHNSPQAVIVITSTQSGKADVQAWGIRQVHISFLPCPKECGICHNEKADECKFWNQVALTWFKTDVAIEGWNLANGKPKPMECSGVVLFGGFENIGSKSILERKFTDLPPHSKLMVKFQFWKMDNWDNDEFHLKVDGNLVVKQAYQLSDGVDLCGSEETLPGFGEKITNVEVIIKHNKPDITLTLSSTLMKDHDISSWGIRDFFMFVADCTKFCHHCIGPEVNECTKCFDTHILKDGKCINKLNWYIAKQQFFEKKDFSALDEWEIQEADEQGSKPPISECGDVGLIGGYKNFAKKTVASRKFDMPAHDFVRIKMQLYKIDNWDGEELIVSVDKHKLWSQQLGWNDAGSSNLCGDPDNNWKERVINIDKIIPHTDKILTLELTSTLLRTAEKASWGFREVLVLYQPAQECITVYSECGFKGKEGRICENVNSMEEQKINFDIKSMKIPEGMKLTGYKNAQFKGDRVEFETDQECIEKLEFQFIQKRQFLGYNKQLRSA